ncbi:HDIG domain-containing metalloprotein [uncultured Robinsoniella sp.]|uniref:HDIG domain-containing metalloprotein n=1 Tax=uncultured Robinsoniella sp. TaxID=904190 RepID=UPI00374E3A87
MTRDARARRARSHRNDMNQEFYECIRDIMEHPVVLLMKKFPHHCDTDCYQHCMNVAYYNYQICKVLGLDARAAARAGMLHDLFLYDWREHAAKTGDRFHGLTHPKVALRRAEKYFDLNDMEKDIILKHMWPLTIIPPKYFESYIICLTDKYCGACEITDHYSGKIMPKRIKLPFGYRTMYQLASKVAPVVGARAGIGEYRSSKSHRVSRESVSRV